ncbi:DUF3562 domain-containing protein [Paraburkholderia sp. MM5482-R1]
MRPPVRTSGAASDTWAEYSEVPKIMDYVPVPVAKRVRDALRRAAKDAAR